MVTFQVTKEMDQEEWEDHVLGSGAFSWSWWKLADANDEGVEVTWYTDIDNSTETETKFLTYQEIADKCSELARDHRMVAAQLANNDFDADGMDQVLQYAYMGEVVYG